MAAAPWDLVVGVCRVFFGLKGWEYYISNNAFWGKIVAFVVVGLLSVPPTMRILAWRNKSGETGVGAGGRDARRPLLAQGRDRILALIPIFAAAMARGIGI